MPTLGTQTIQSSYTQLLKTDGLGGIDATLQAVTDGDNTVSALELSSAGVRSTGTLNVAGATTLSSSLAVTGAVTLSSSLGVTGAATFSSSISATTGTATIGTLSASTATISTATISTATIPLQLGAITFGSNITASTGTATLGTATISTATIGTLFASGSATFGTNITASTGTATLGTIASTTINNSGLATVGTLQVATSSTGPKITNVSYGTFAFSGGTVQTHAANDTTTGTFALPCQLGDIVIASINSLGSTTGTGALIATNFFPIATDVVEYNIIGKGTTAGTIPAGTIFATAMRFTA
jgi:hypothetical protein